MRHRIAGFIAAALIATSCAAIGPKPGVYDVKDVEAKLPHRSMEVTLVAPAAHGASKPLVLFATGDAGWFGTSSTILKHIAERGYPVAAYNSRKVVADIKSHGGIIKLNEGVADLEALAVFAKKQLGLAPETPTIVAGFSRGASMVVFAAGDPKIQKDAAGAVALALTREADYLRAPNAAQRPPGIEVDEKGRVLTYPAISRLGPLPIAVIQGANDKYVPAAESRRLFGPDTTTRRLFEVAGASHGFGGKTDEMLGDLDAALDWISSRPSGGASGRP